MVSGAFLHSPRPVRPESETLGDFHNNGTLGVRRAAHRMWVPTEGPSPSATLHSSLLGIARGPWQAVNPPGQ